MKYQTELPEYNTTRGIMQISEYGRNIQKMVEVAIAEPDREKRNKLANALIQLMGILNPHLRDVADYKHKLWDHLFVISNFKLDVDSPYPIPTQESLQSKPETVQYPQQRIRYKFYGKNVEHMIAKAAEMEEGQAKATFINLIGSFMKQSCKSWNEEQLSDEEILSHLELLSGGKISMGEQEDVQFNALQDLNRNRNFRPDNNTRNFRNGGNNNNRNFRNGGNNNNRNNTGGRNNNNNNNRNNQGGGNGSSGNGGNNGGNRNFRNNNNKNRPN